MGKLCFPVLSKIISSLGFWYFMISEDWNHTLFASPEELFLLQVKTTDGNGSMSFPRCKICMRHILGGSV